MKRLRLYFDVAWRPALYYGFLALAIFGVLFFQLGRLIQGSSLDEQLWYGHLINRDLGLRAILEQPLYLPYQLAVYVLEKAHVTSLGVLRGISAGFGAIAVVSFYYVIRTWYTRRMALFGAAILLSSSWFLHIARFASPDVLYLSPIVLIAFGLWLNNHKRLGNLPLTYIAIISAGLLYIPGMIWLILSCAIWQRKQLLQGLSRIKGWQTAVGLTGSLLILAPLVRMIVMDPASIKSLMGLPRIFPSLNDFLYNLIAIPKALFVQGPSDPARWVGTMPLLDIFMITMFIFGAYVYMLRFRLDRVKILFAVFLIASLFIASGGPVSLTFLMPFVFIVVVAGLAYFLQLWFDIFPRNPFARTLASSLAVLLIAMSAFYNLQHYFIAWPNAPETKAAHTQLRR